MICTCIQHKTYEEILSLLDDPWIEMAEIRLDRCQLSTEQIEDLFANTDTPLIATCRIAETGAVEAERRLSAAIRAGALRTFPSWSRYATAVTATVPTAAPAQVFT